MFIGPFGLQPKGTMSVRALPLAKALAARGHAVSVLIPPWDDPARDGQEWQEDGVEVVNVPLPGKGLPRLPLLFQLLLTRTLATQAQARQPEVIHFFKPKAYAGLAHLVFWWLRRAGKSGPRLVVDADDWEQAWNKVLPYPAWQKKFFAWQERWGLSHADAVTVASRALVDLAGRVGVNRERICYVPNGIRPGVSGRQAAAPFLPFADVPTILLYSRFAEFRLARIVTLVQRVAGLLPQARWLVAGRGFAGEEQTLAANLAKAGLAHYVHFTGWVAADRLPALFAAADVAVHPYDNTLLNRTKCSVKLVDLLASGVPVVADAVGQNCEYIEDGVSGILVPPEDDEAMARAVAGLLQKPAERQRLGQAAQRAMQQNFTWTRLAQRVERIYRWE